MVVNEIELQEQLKETGNRLLDPPSSIDELLNLLDVMHLFSRSTLFVSIFLGFY